jgi:hypothetical protein
MLRKGLLAGVVGSVMMLVVAAPAASAADSWDRASQDFGSRNAGTKSDPLQFALIAQCDAFTGTALLCASPPNGVHNYGAITTTGPFAIDPATDVCNARGGVLLTPGASQPVDVCTLQVAFQPTSGGVKNGTLSTTTSPSGAPLSVALTGIGVAIGKKKTPGTTTPGQTIKKKCKKKGKKRSASAAKKKCKKKKK